MPNEPLRRYASLSARRGREAYIQLRVRVHALRSQHVEPKTIWVSPATADDMRALWFEVTTVTGGRYHGQVGFDGVLPSIAGVAVREGSTGGNDYVVELHESAAESYAARDAMDRLFRVQDNPLDGTH